VDGDSVGPGLDAGDADGEAVGSGLGEGAGVWLALGVPLFLFSFAFDAKAVDTGAIENVSPKRSKTATDRLSTILRRRGVAYIVFFLVNEQLWLTSSDNWDA
jgi:hypothetical protein